MTVLIFLWFSFTTGKIEAFLFHAVDLLPDAFELSRSLRL